MCADVPCLQFVCRNVRAAAGDCTLLALHALRGVTCHAAVVQRLIMDQDSGGGVAGDASDVAAACCHAAAQHRERPELAAPCVWTLAQVATHGKQAGSTCAGSATALRLAAAAVQSLPSERDVASGCARFVRALVAHGPASVVVDCVVHTLVPVLATVARMGATPEGGSAGATAAGGGLHVTAVSAVETLSDPSMLVDLLWACGRLRSAAPVLIRAGLLRLTTSILQHPPPPACQTCSGSDDATTSTTLGVTTLQPGHGCTLQRWNVHETTWCVGDFGAIGAVLVWYSRAPLLCRCATQVRLQAGGSH